MLCVEEIDVAQALEHEQSLYKPSIAIRDLGLVLARR